MTNMELVVDHLGCAYGQHDYEMRVLDGSVPVGLLSFSEFAGRPHVNWIQVEESHIHRGIARRMIQNLQARYDGVPIDFGYTTPNGTLLVEGLRFREVPNEAYQTAQEKRLHLAARLAEYQTAADRLKTAEGKNRETILAALEDWNEVSDALETVEDILEQEPRVFRLVETDADSPEVSGFVINP